MNIFKLVGTVFVDTDAANQSLQKTDKKANDVGATFLNGVKKVGKFAVALGAATAAGGAALMGVAQKAAETTDRIDKMSQKIGISRTSFQELDFITSQCGASVDGLKVGMKTLTNQMQMAEQGSATATEAFEALGLSWTDNTGKMKDQETMMWEAFSALQACEDQTMKAALASDLFGKAGTELMPMLNGASGSIEEMKQKAHELGLVLNDDAIDAGVVFTDTVDQAKRSLGTLVAQVGVKVMPIIQQGLDYLIANMPEIQVRAEKAFTVMSTVVSTTVKVFVSLVEWVEKNKVLITALAIAVGVITTAYGIYNAIQAAKTAMNLAETASLSALIAAQLASAAATWAAMAPIIAIVAAIAAVIAIIVLCVKHWDKIKEAVGKAMDFMKAKVKSVVSSVVNFFSELPKKAAEKLEDLKSKFKSKLESLQTLVKNIVAKIKGFFNFTFNIPKMKLPHFTIKPKGWKLDDLLKGVKPKLGIDWYAKAMDKGMILNKPTIFGMNSKGQFMGGGEAGSETIVGTKSLLDMINGAVASENKELVAILKAILSAIKDMDSGMYNAVNSALDNRKIQWNDRELGRLVSKYAG